MVEIIETDQALHLAASSKHQIILENKRFLIPLKPRLRLPYD